MHSEDFVEEHPFTGIILDDAYLELINNHVVSEKLLEMFKNISVDAMAVEYWPISVVLTSDCRQNYLHLRSTEAVKFRGWLVEKGMMADRQKFN